MLIDLLSEYSALMDLEHKYKKIIKKHNDRSITGRAKAYFFEAKRVKEQIKELKEDVERVKTKFMASLFPNVVTSIGADVKDSTVPSLSSKSNRSKFLTRWSLLYQSTGTLLHLGLQRRMCQAQPNQ